MFDIVKIRFNILFYSRITVKKKAQLRDCFRDAPIIKKWLALRFVTRFLCSTIPLKGRVCI